MPTSTQDLLPTLQGFNAFDWLLLAILLWSAITAFMRGLLRELFALVGLAAGILLAGRFYLALARHLGVLSASSGIRDMVAFLLITFGVMILAGLLGRLLRRTASLLGLGALDRLLGAAFGLGRGFLVGVALVTALTAFFPPQGWLRRSHLAPYFLAGAHGVSFVVPQGLQQRITEGVAQIR